MKGCTGRTALPKVKAFSKTKDGHAAWTALKKLYDKKGSTEHVISSNLKHLVNERLEYNTPKGLDGYISAFQTHILRLEESGYELTDLFKKICLLNGINDSNYESIITLCRNKDDYDYNDSIDALTHHAEENGLTMAKTQRRYNNNTNFQQNMNHNNGNNNRYQCKQSTKIKYEFLPDNIWDLLSPAQCEQYLQGSPNYNKMNTPATEETTHSEKGPPTTTAQINTTKTSMPDLTESSKTENPLEKPSSQAGSSNIWKTMAQQKRSPNQAQYHH